MELREACIRRIMYLTHERGREMGREEVIRRAKRLIRYLRETEGLVDADLEYALYYWRELLEND